MGKYSEGTAPAWASEAIVTISQALGVDASEIYANAVAPPKAELGDLAVPMFAYAKKEKTAPPVIAQRIAAACKAELSLIKAEGPYVNVVADRSKVLQAMLTEVASKGASFGHAPASPDKEAVIDYSSPNIAKPLAFHHIRSTMIGHSLARILRASGYKVHGVNHLGDWGTQFGYMIIAHENDAPAAFDKLTIDDFANTYIEQRAKAKDDPSVDEKARDAFARLEKGDEKARKVWKKARDASLERFKRIYDRLGVKFEDDMYIGESHFEPKLPGIIDEAVKKGVAKESDGALIVDLEAHGIDTPCLLRKRDGATLYATRDIAAARFRHDEFGGDKKQWQSLYVVDAGQSLHFKQLFKVMELLGEPWADRLKHVPFGVLLLWSEEEQAWIKGKTRSGHVILLEEVLDEAIKRVTAVIDEKNPELADKQAIAAAIGVGAVVFNDLKHKRTNDVKFKYDEALSLEGETGPYIHNALVRTKSILRKAGRAVPTQYDATLLTHVREGALAMQLASYAEVIARAAAEYDPSLIARFVLDLAGAFHAFHHDCHVLDATNPALSDARLALTAAVSSVLENAMSLIGLQSIEAM